MTQVAAFPPVKPSSANSHLAGGVDRACGPTGTGNKPLIQFPSRKYPSISTGVAPSPRFRDGKDRELSNGYLVIQLLSVMHFKEDEDCSFHWHV